MAIVHEFSPLVEQTSIDEAYVDLSDQVDRWDGAVEAAREIQRRIEKDEGLSASLGVASNKLVAKVASDQNKPGGLTVVRPGEEAAFLAPLSVRVLWGIGPVTAAKLAEMNITTVGQLATVPEKELRARFGRHGGGMARQALGIDRRRVVTEREAKSVSHETTFSRDLTDAKALGEHLKGLSQKVARRLQRSDLAAGTVAVKLRYADFETLTRQTTLSVPTNDADLICQAALFLLGRAWKRGHPVRLLGVAGRHLSPSPRQLPLFKVGTDDNRGEQNE
jgi:DNA polymerase-4